MRRTVLFLCTGNYYRSRFAEELFNAVAQEQGADWRAISRALATELSRRNVGPISPHAIDGLTARGLSIAVPARFPRGVQRFELVNADLTIALNEREHRPLLSGRFPDWVERVEYWSIDDVDADTPDNVLPKLDAIVRDLVRRLSSPR